jgi:hypothetical protein
LDLIRPRWRCSVRRKRTGANKKWDSVGPAISGVPPHDTQSREKGFKCGDLFLVGDFYCFAHHAA